MVDLTVEEFRRRNEAQFHDRWAADFDPAKTLVDEVFTSATAVENRHILSEFGDLTGRTVLDYGCGCGEGAVYLAKRGARVVAMDVSNGMLEATRQLAAYHHVDVETRAVTGAGIPARDAEFDLIYGQGVLHHVSLDAALPELARVMTPGGRGCFIEPLPYNPLINIYRRIANEVRTPDERPLTFADVNGFTAWFDQVSHKEFWLTTLAVFLRFYVWERVHPNKERYWKKIYTDASRIEPFFTPLQRLDDRILTLFPWLGRFCWVTVITVSKPRKA